MRILILSFILLGSHISMSQVMNKEYISFFPLRDEVIGFPTSDDTLRFTNIHIDKRFLRDDLSGFTLKADKIAFNINNDSSFYEADSLVINSPIFEFVLYSNDTEVYKSFTNFPLRYQVNHALLMSDFVLECKFPELK